MIVQDKKELMRKFTLPLPTQKSSSFRLKIRGLEHVTSQQKQVESGLKMFYFLFFKVFAKQLDEKLTQLTRKDPVRFR